MKKKRMIIRDISIITAAGILMSMSGCSSSQPETVTDGEETTVTAAEEETDASSPEEGYETVTLTDDTGTYTITEGGAYLITGETSYGQVIVDAGGGEVSLILRDATIENPDSACICILSAGDVTLTLEGENNLTNGGTFEPIGDVEVEAAVYSQNDLTVDGDGTLNIVSPAGDGIRSNDTLTIESGTFDIDSDEGLESTVIIINGGDITIAATDDGINASEKSETLSPYLEINGGNISITMADGDTDGIDSNGDITINGGVVSINGQSPIDYDGTAVFNGGTLILNGVEVDEITNQFEEGMLPSGEGMPADGSMPGPSDRTMPEPPDGTMPEPPDGTMPEPPEGGMPPDDMQAPTEM